MKFLEYNSSAQMMAELAKTIATDITKVLSCNKHATLAVPGGNTPGPMFDILSDLDIAWNNINILLTDERWVRVDHERSNTRLLRNRLLKNKAINANLVQFYSDEFDAKSGAEHLSQKVKHNLPLGVLVLGMGTDMHCASLFPNAPELQAAQANDAPSVCPMSPGDGLEPRVTLSARSLETAQSTHILIIGNEKKKALNAALDLPFAKAPVAQFLKNSTIHWAET